MNAAIEILMRPASEPPASMMSACPRRIVSVASPIACALEAHADTCAMFGPFAPYFIAISPAAMSRIIIGMRNAETLFGSFACASTLSTSVDTPPIPDPNATPMRGAFSFVISTRAFFKACPAAATAIWAKRSARRTSLRSM